LARAGISIQKGRDKFKGERTFGKKGGVGGTDINTGGGPAARPTVVGLSRQIGTRGDSLIPLSEM